MHENAISPDKNKSLYERVKNRLHKGEEDQQDLIARVGSMVIRDKLVAPTAMQFTQKDGYLHLYYGEPIPSGSTTVNPLTIHKHALTQLAQKVNIPIQYTHALMARKEEWKVELLSHILNESFHKTVFSDKTGQPRFLHRIVGTELRGFLSKRFNRHIASAPLLRAFLEACTQMGAFPFSAIATDIKVALKCMLPDVFEPVKGQYVCAGVEWSNSDFGAGRMQVALSLWMPAQDTFTVLDHVISRVHIGSVIEESDIELTEETMKKEVEVQCLAIRDSVKAQISHDSVDRLLAAIAEAHQREIPWDKLKGQLIFLPKSDIATLEQAMQEAVSELPPLPKNSAGAYVPTRWWTSAALSWLAGETRDPEKRLELEHKAGSFLEIK